MRKELGKVMKKIICFYTACILLWMNSISVYADVIWEPSRDAFYNEYREKCEYLNRTYIANGVAGEVAVYKNPESQKVVDTWENGKAVYISFSYEAEDGSLWGIYDNGDRNQSGWVRLDNMVVQYDYISFEEECGTKIVEESGTLASAEEGTVYFWEYPGAKTYHSMNVNEGEVGYNKTFVDEEGYKWGYIGYFYGMRHKWICLDMPVAEYEELYPNGGPKRNEQTVMLPESQEETISQDASTEIKENTVIRDEVIPQEDVKSQIPFVAGIVAAVVAVTGALLVFLKKSFCQKNNENQLTFGKDRDILN